MNMSIFEIGMLACFGISWPISIAKSIRTKTVTGKSPMFMIILYLGYASDVTHKLVYSLDPVIVLYALNFVLIATDLALYYKYLPKNKTAAAATNPGPPGPRNNG